MILKQGHTYEPMPHDGKVIRRIYRGGRCYYKDSPYSLAATQALKAAFPQYWTAIRDYGWANPAIVPFVNEDPMLIVSLVEVGKTRWLVGDGANITTGISLSGCSYIKAIYKYGNSAGDGMSLGSRVGGSGTNGLMLQLSVDSLNNVRLYMIPGGSSGWPVIHSNILPNIVNEIDVLFDKNIIISNGVSKSQVFNQTAIDSAYLNSVFRNAYCAKIWTDTNTLIPYHNGTEAGMLDIVSLTFYPNANTQGTFTIAITDKE